MKDYATIKGYIYKITNPNGQIYIGQTINILQRKNKYSKPWKKYKGHIYNSIRKYGWKNHIFETIEEIICGNNKFSSVKEAYLCLCISKSTIHRRLNNPAFLNYIYLDENN